MKHIKDDDPIKREIAAEALSNFANKKSKDALKMLLRDEQEFVRAMAAESLGILKDKSAVDDLIVLLDDRVEFVRIESIDSLGAIKSIKAEDALIHSLLKDKSAIARGYAAESLAEIGSVKAYKIIRKKLLTEKQGHAKLRMYGALYMMGDNKSITRIYEYLKSRYYRIRCAAVNTLIFILEEDDVNETAEILAEFYEKEKTIAVRSSIESFFKEYDIDGLRNPD